MPENLRVRWSYSSGGGGGGHLATVPQGLAGVAFPGVGQDGGGGAGGYKAHNVMHITTPLKSGQVRSGQVRHAPNLLCI